MSEVRKKSKKRYEHGYSVERTKWACKVVSVHKYEKASIVKKSTFFFFEVIENEQGKRDTS